MRGRGTKGTEGRKEIFSDVSEGDGGEASLLLPRVRQRWDDRWRQKVNSAAWQASEESLSAADYNWPACDKHTRGGAEEKVEDRLSIWLDVPH